MHLQIDSIGVLINLSISVKNQLLPEGFRDSLPELAFKEDKVNSIFVKLMQNNGFLLVKPPLLEFESSLFFLLNEKEESNLI